MLEQLFISKVRVKLLQTFLSQPNEIFYVRQLVRSTQEEINAVRRELAHMETSGMVNKETRGNRLYYWFKKVIRKHIHFMGIVHAPQPKKNQTDTERHLIRAD